MEWVIKGAKVFAEENNTNIKTQIQLQFSSNSVELLTLFLCNTTTTTTLELYLRCSLKWKGEDSFPEQQLVIKSTTNPSSSNNSHK